MHWRRHGHRHGGRGLAAANTQTQTIRISAAVHRAILAHARAETPRECCGLLLGSWTEIVDVVPARNAATTPTTRYLVDPHDHLRAIRLARSRALQVVGAYHSHPRGPAVPSATDAAEAFPDFLFLLVGLGTDPPELKGWRWQEGNFTPLVLVRVPEDMG